MLKMQQAVLTALEGAQTFLDQNGMVLASVNASVMRRTLDDAITRLRQQKLEQDTTVRLSRGARAGHAAARQVLLQHHMQGIIVAARADADLLPQLAAMKAPSSKRATPALIGEAESLARVAGEHVDHLAPILGANFLQDLYDAIQQVKEALASGRDSRVRRTAATANIVADVRRGLAAVRVLDVLIRRAAAEDSGLLRGWKACRRVVRKAAAENEDTGTESDSETPTASEIQIAA